MNECVSRTSSVEAIAMGDCDSDCRLKFEGAHLNIVHERIACFGIVLGLDEQQLIAE